MTARPSLADPLRGGQPASAAPAPSPEGHVSAHLLVVGFGRSGAHGATSQQAAMLYNRINCTSAISLAVTHAVAHIRGLGTSPCQHCVPGLRSPAMKDLGAYDMNKNLVSSFGVGSIRTPASAPVIMC